MQQPPCYDINQVTNETNTTSVTTHKNKHFIYTDKEDMNSEQKKDLDFAAYI